jgi:hypothetical protein
LLGAGGFDIGALVEPGPDVLPGVHGLATVAETPGVAALAVVEPAPLLVVEVPDAVVELVVVEGVVALPIELLVPGFEVEVPALPMVVVLPGLDVEVLAFPTLVPLLEGVQGATVVVVPERFAVVP